MLSWQPCRNYFWPTLLSLLGLSFLLLVVWSVKQAHIPGSTPTAAYLTRGKLTAADAWSGRFSSQGRHFQAELADAAGVPLTGFQGHIVITTRAGVDLAVSVVESSTGTYRALLPEGMNGTRTVRLDLERAGVLLSRTLTLQLGDG